MGFVFTTYGYHKTVGVYPNPTTHFTGDSGVLVVSPATTISDSGSVVQGTTVAY